MDEDQAYRQILEANLYSMLYCVRSKETCVEIIRMFIKNPALFEELKLQVLKIERISKIQTKKQIFNELSTSLSNSTQ